VEGVQGSEDIVADPEGRRAYLSVTDFRALERGDAARGAIYAWDLEAGGAPVPVADDLDGPFHPHGLSLIRTAGGELRLFAVSHPDRASSRVEIFVVDEGPPLALRHARTVARPELTSLNDVAAVGPEQFYATVDAGTRPDDALRPVETFLRLPWSSVVYFDGARLATVVSGLTYANGVALSRDGRRVFVAETTGRRLTAYDRDEATGALAQRNEVSIGTGLDNISVAADDALWIAAHPRMLDFLRHARDPRSASPSQVLRVTLGWSGLEVEDVFLDDGRALSGSSVALPVGADRFLVGSVFERHFLDCRRDPATPPTPPGD
jgi:arylesterase/paraoxonase